MKWFFFYLFAQSFGWQGPFDDQAACMKALQKGVDNYFGAIDPGFYQGATPAGLCFQGAQILKGQK